MYDMLLHRKIFMQLFILDKNPLSAVQMLADVHVRKMCLETAQILSAVAVRFGRELSCGMPKPYNVNHPVIKAIDSQFKINYTVFYNHYLQDEYLYRFKKQHKYYELAQLYSEILFIRNCVEDWSFCRNFKDFVTETPDIVMAYREYYLFKKSIILNWHYTKRKEPDFLL